MHPITKVVIIAATAWFYLFVFMWAGYLLLTFFGWIESTPIIEVPQVPFIPGFNDNLPTTTTIPWVPSG